MTVLADGAFDPQGPAADSIAGLWWTLLALGAAVYVGVIVLLVRGLWRRRTADAPEPESDARSAHLLRRWVIGGGVVMPAVILVVVLVATVLAMRDLPTDGPAGALEVEIVGHQWWWEVRYPEEEITTANELHIPVGRPVELQLTSADVIHSFWVPELAGKMDLLPDGTNTLVLEADEPGRHTNECAEFCGLQHAQMAMVVTAEAPERFEDWVASRQRPAPEPTEPTAQEGQEVFRSRGCASCHTIEGTSDGDEGPDLTHFASRPTIGAGAVPNSPDDLATWVADPHAIKNGVEMPAIDLDDDELDAVLAYLEGLE